MKLKLLLPFLLAGCFSVHADNSATLVNIAADGNPLTDALKEAQIPANAAEPQATSGFPGQLVVWEAKARPISQQTVDALSSYVQQGGSLLIGMDLHPGLMPVQVGFLSPTTGWGSQNYSAGRGDTGGEIAIGTGDPELFSSKDLPSVVLPYHVQIRPFSAVERCMSRYDLLPRENNWLKTPHTAGDFFWSRPLLNRDWKIRLQASDRAASPLLLTGRYGAGRVAVFAAALDTPDPAMGKIWKPVLQWLTAPAPANQTEPAADAAQFTTTIVPPTDKDKNSGGVDVAIKSTATQAMKLQIVGRILTWEWAPIGDNLQTVQVPAGGTVTVHIPLPADEPTQYQALQWRRSFMVRVGLLSESGATLLQEKSLPVDLSPTTGVEVYTDNLYQVPTNFPNAPGSDLPGGLKARMGTQLGAYMYPPGQTVNATVVLTNGQNDLTPWAVAKDETTPDNVSVISLTHGASTAEKPPREATNAYGYWQGKADTDNVLSFHFNSPVNLAGISLNGDPSDFRQYSSHNPASVIIECDGKQVAQADDLDSQFVSTNGLIHVLFAPVQVSDVRIRLPWTNSLPSGKKRTEPWLGNIALLGTIGAMPPELKGDAILVARDSMTGVETVAGKKSISIPPGGRVEWPQAVPLPQESGHFYQLEARFAGQTTQVPIAVLKPDRTLTPINQLKTSDAPALEFIVTRGFRNLFPLGTGTQEMVGAWETADDLIWCYAHCAKQISINSKTKSDWLYLTDNNLAHYSDPWSVFPNGESIFEAATPNLISEMKKNPKWATSDKAIFGFSDRWDSGPAVGAQYSWQEYVGFDDYLRSKGGAGLTGKTRGEIAEEIKDKYAGQWSAWQEQFYDQTVVSLSKAFTAEGKQILWGGQGIPFTSTKTAENLSNTVNGMSDDDTWGMEEDSITWTTARQLIVLAYNPAWKVNMNFVWGWNSGVLQNKDWYAVSATTEPSRRHYYDSSWRGLIGADGQYRSSLTYGFGQNGSTSWLTNANDYQELWRAQQRFSLIYPDAPLGAGFIVASSLVDSPESTLFSGGGMGGAPAADAAIYRGTRALGQIHDCGLSVPFVSNVLALKNWKGAAPLILFDLSQVSDEEVQVLKSLGSRGIKIAAFAGQQALSPAASALFGVKADGTADKATAAGNVDGKTLLSSGNFLFVPMMADAMTLPVAQEVTDILRPWLAIPITFPEGTMGYGFISGKQKCVVLEDWMEKGRMALLRIHADGTEAKAVSLNDHRALDLKRDGADWLVQVPLRPGDGEMVVLQEGK